MIPAQEREKRATHQTWGEMSEDYDKTAKTTQASRIKCLASSQLTA